MAAIRGACPAGGCCLSLCCDFRIMTDFGHIGLNEVALGISVRRRVRQRLCTDTLAQQHRAFTMLSQLQRSSLQEAEHQS